MKEKSTKELTVSLDSLQSMLYIKNAISPECHSLFTNQRHTLLLVQEDKTFGSTASE